jgi:hypothetical protein
MSTRKKAPAPAAAPAESRPRTPEQLIAKARKMRAERAKRPMPAGEVKDLLKRARARLNPKKTTG